MGELDIAALELDPEVSNQAIGEQIQNLSKRLETINEELEQQVREKHTALLQQATHAGRFDHALNGLSEGVKKVRSTAYSLKNQIDTQYQLIENQGRVLGHLHECSHLLRSAGTLLNLTSKLKNTKDVLKQAEIHYELSPLIDDEGLKEIEFLQDERAYVIASNQKIKNLTQMQLVTGLQERNEGQVINALKVFMTLNTLTKSLENLVVTFITDLDQSLKECFAGNDITVLKSDSLSSNIKFKQSPNNIPFSRGPGKTPQLTTTHNFRAKFWKSLHWLIYDELFENCEQIKLLRRCLENINQFNYVAEHKHQAIHNRFWQAVQILLKKSFTECPPHVVQTLQEGLSKLLSSVRGLEQRLNGEFIFNNEIFASLETGYVSKCGANLKLCLAGVDLPSNETVDNFIRIASTELSAALIDDRLAAAITAVITSCGRELCSKLEAQIKLGADSKQVVDIPNIQQMQNITLANVLFYYKDSMSRMLQDLSDQFANSESKDVIAKSLEQADILISTILQQIVDSIISTIFIIMISMHREPGLNTEKIAVSGPSMYMKELQEFIARSWINHIEPFDDKEIVKSCGHELGKRCIELFVHNLSILRPLSNAGRQRMKNDCLHMEQALKPVTSTISELGKPARLLRALAQIILQQPSELVKQSVGGEVLIPSYIILFLLFGHATPELQSPHAAANWSNDRLVEWLEGHTSEREKLDLIAGALQRYRDHVRRQNSEQYDEIYPLMVNFFEKATKAF